MGTFPAFIANRFARMSTNYLCFHCFAMFVVRKHPKHCWYNLVCILMSYTCKCLTRACIFTLACMQATFFARALKQTCTYANTDINTHACTKMHKSTDM